MSALSDGEAALSWFGQASFAARGGGTTVLFDPFLSPYDGRLHDSPLAPGERVGIDVVFCSHEHVDHLDVPSIGRHRDRLPGRGVRRPVADRRHGHRGRRSRRPRRRACSPGGSTEVGGLTVRAVPACHGVTMDDAYGFGESLSGGLVRFLGFVVDLGGVRIYHAGDTIHFDGMEETLAGSGSTSRCSRSTDATPSAKGAGIVGNLDHREAAWLGSRSAPDSWCRCTTTCSRATWGSRARSSRRWVESSRRFPSWCPRATGRSSARRRRDAVRALVYLGPGPDGAAGRSGSDPGPGEVVIASTASAICGSDLQGSARRAQADPAAHHGPRDGGRDRRSGRWRSRRGSASGWCSSRSSPAARAAGAGRERSTVPERTARRSRYDRRASPNATVPARRPRSRSTGAPSRTRS